MSPIISSNFLKGMTSPSCKLASSSKLYMDSSIGRLGLKSVLELLGFSFSGPSRYSNPARRGMKKPWLALFCLAYATPKALGTKGF